MMYIDETSFYATAQSEPLPVDHEYSSVRRGVRRVGYGLEVGHSGRGGGISCRHAHSLLFVELVVKILNITSITLW